ncbi:FG-GAP repeat protein [Sphaerisporangium aureirubrum]|uniref:FG-GAP repeat protein n=1 Tax=Sphaerisporangium aureirubrum TaxID=1544736 RepID=A0ABW1NCM2_9ACTN
MSASRASRLLAAAAAVAILPMSAALSPAAASVAACRDPGLAVAAPYATVDGQTHAGSVTLYQGNRAAVTLTQGTEGIADTPERGDSFGSAVATGDFDGDGCADLAIGASEEFAGTPVPDGADGNGVVHLLRGTSRGLRPSGTLDVTHLGRTRGTDRFGAALVAADLDGDGDDELIVGVPGLEGGGGVALFGMRGREPDGTGSLITQGTRWVGQDGAESDQFGAAVAAGDFDGDGKAELAIGAPGDDVGDKAAAGSFTIADPRARQAGMYTQNSPGMPGDSEKYDGLGGTLAAGDFNGDGRTDLAAGVPGEGLDAFQDGPMYGDGAVHVLYGRRGGLTAIGGEFWSRKTAGVSGRNRPTDRLGSALAAGDLNGDGDAELAIGVPGGNAVLVLAGTRTGGLTANHNLTVTGRKGHPGDAYGTSVAITPSGLVVGAPGGGRVVLVPSTVRKGSYTGLRPATSTTLSGPAGALFGFAVTR